MTRRDVRVIGAEPGRRRGCVRLDSHSGAIVELDHIETIADGLRARRIGDRPVEPAIGAHVDEIRALPCPNRPFLTPCARCSPSRAS